MPSVPGKDAEQVQQHKVATHKESFLNADFKEATLKEASLKHQEPASMPKVTSPSLKIVEEEVAKARHNKLPARSKIWVALRFSNHRAMYTVTGDRRMLEPRINGHGHR